MIVFFSCSTVAVADTSELSYDNLTPNDGIKALELGDALGYKVIPREELEEIRGEQYQYPAYLLNGAYKLRESMFACTNNGICGGAILRSLHDRITPGPTCIYSGTGHSTAAYCY